MDTKRDTKFKICLYISPMCISGGGAGAWSSEEACAVRDVCGSHGGTCRLGTKQGKCPTYFDKVYLDKIMSPLSPPPPLGETYTSRTRYNL